MNYPIAAGNITIGPRCAPSPGGFPVPPRNSILQPGVRHDYQPSGHGDTTQEPIPDDTPAAVTSSPGVAADPSPFNQIPGVHSGYLVSGHPSSYPLIHSGAVLPAHTTYQSEGNGLSTSQQLLGQTYQGNPTLSTAIGPVRGVGVDQHPSRYDYQPSGHSDTTQEPIPGAPPTVVTASPRGTVYLPPFTQTPGVYPVSGRPLPPSLVNCGVIPPTHTTYQNEGNGQSISRQLGQTYQDTPTFSATAEPIRGMGVDQHPSRYQCTRCDHDYAQISGLNRHFMDKHAAWMVCSGCNSEFSLGRVYKYTEHLQTCPGA